MVIFTILPNGNLQISPDDLEALSDVTDLSEAFESELCNGWSWISPEDVGALTDGEIITQDAVFDDDGNLVSIGRVFWNAQYAVRDTLGKLQAGETVVWGGYKA